MRLRPSFAHWVEIRVPREQIVLALEALAASGAIELEDDPTAGPADAKTELRQMLGRIRDLEQRYRDELPTDERSPPRLVETPEHAARESLGYLRQWCLDLVRNRRAVRGLERQRHRLSLLAECLAAMHDQSEGLDGFSHPTRFLAKQMLACPKEVLNDPRAEKVLSEVFPGERHDFWLVAGIPEHAALMDSAATLLACRPVDIPDWLSGDAGAQRQLVSERLAAVEEALRIREAAIAAHRADPGIRETLANVRILDWYAGITLRETYDHTGCRLAGWTPAGEADQLERVLREAGVEASVVFTEPTVFNAAPIALDGSYWAAPFRWVMSRFGTPSQSEVDPTPVLAVVVPLLFGFMFPDVGHGLILALVGLVLARRSPAGQILMRCGVSAALFGAAFGEFFGIHGVLPAPLGVPLEQPLRVLGMSLVIGAGLLLLGLVFSGVEAAWQGQLRHWALDGAPVLALYLAMLIAIVWPAALLAAATAVVWYIVGAFVLCRPNGLGCVGGRVGHLLEATLQLAINTLSFLRIGAFALAHCALSLMVVELASAIDSFVLRAVAFVLGQALIIVLEALVVSVQITRLVLFEFFIRFLRLEGRPYRPMAKPPAHHAA